MHSVDGMIYRCPLTQSNFNSLQQQFYYQAHGQKIVEAGKGKQDTHRGSSGKAHPAAQPSGGGGWKLALLLAAPSILSAIDEICDPVVQQGDQPLRKSHLRKIMLACSFTLAAEISLEEELALESIVQQAWIHKDAVSMQAFLSLADHAATVQTAKFEEWREKASALLLHPGKQQQVDGSLMLWANRVTLRKSVGSDVIPADVMRKTIADSKTLKDRTSATTLEIEKLHKEVETLQGEVAGREKELRNEERGISDAERHLAEHLFSNNGGFEFGLRRHFVRNKASLKDFYIHPHIPDNKLTNARAACGVPASEKVIALFDLTVFGSAKDAVIFTETGIYFRTPQAILMPYPNLSAYDICGGSSDITFVHKIKGQGTYKVSGMLGHAYVVEALRSVQRLLA